jgi:asparagine synthase (glutamine-hydrolysing)
MRDLLAHRGPDAAGLVRERNVALAHRRLALLDREGGVQPFVLAEPGLARVVLAWNGEIYDHERLRGEFERDGRRFRTRSDTETLAYVLAAHGVDGLRRLRGMFAIAAWFPDDHRLVLARDSFGIVPLFHARAGREIVFASEPAPILAHPSYSIEPDWATIASYLEIPRRSYGSATLFRGISMVEPGEAIEFDLSDPRLPASHHAFTPATGSAASGHVSPGDEDSVLDVRAAVEDSVAAHLVADAPVATLLSGGIDSTIIASIARARSPHLVTFAAGATVDAANASSDLFMARRVAELLRSEHHEVLVDEDAFGDRWNTLLATGLLPLATPNEIAISMLSERIAPKAKAALSGEGADELFGGYGAPIEATVGWIDAAVAHTPEAAADFYRTAFGWSPRGFASELLAPSVHALATAEGRDPLGALLLREYAEAGDLGTLDAHLAVQRRVNLVNLLERLNLSLMRGSVEGRVPFADPMVLGAAQRAGTAQLFGAARSAHDAGGIATAAGTLVTKRVLRRAFADVLSPDIVARPKASFPLPFEGWIAAHAAWIDGPVSREVFSPAARALVRTQAAQHWRLAWPMLNIARWLDTVFA